MLGNVEIFDFNWNGTEYFVVFVENDEEEIVGCILIFFPWELRSGRHAFTACGRCRFQGEANESFQYNLSFQFKMKHNNFAKVDANFSDIFGHFCNFLGHFWTFSDIFESFWNIFRHFFRHFQKTSRQ